MRASSSVSSGLSRRNASIQLLQQVEPAALLLVVDRCPAGPGPESARPRCGTACPDRSPAGIRRSSSSVRRPLPPRRSGPRTRADFVRAAESIGDPRAERRPARQNRPVFIWQTMPTWFSPSAQQARKHSHIVHVLRDFRIPVGDPDPALPVLLANLRCDGISVLLAVPIAVITLPKDAGIGWPASLSSSGFGSNRSMWLGPPSMNSQITAFGGRLVMRRFRRERILSASRRNSRPSRASTPGRFRRGRCRRSSETRGGNGLACLIALIGQLIPIYEFVRVQQHVAEINQCCRPSGFDLAARPSGAPVFLPSASRFAMTDCCLSRNVSTVSVSDPSGRPRIRQPICALDLRAEIGSGLRDHPPRKGLRPIED